MARKSLKPQLNQIRMWVRQGRTDAWIAHQLEVPVGQVEGFKKEFDLDEEAGAENGSAGFDLHGHGTLAGPVLGVGRVVGN